MRYNDIGRGIPLPVCIFYRYWDGKMLIRVPVICPGIDARCVLANNRAPAQAESETTENDVSARPKLLCKSLGVLSAELHQSQVDTIAKIHAERQRRRDRNHATDRLLMQNPAWQQFATAEHWSAMPRPSECNLIFFIA